MDDYDPNELQDELEDQIDDQQDMSEEQLAAYGTYPTQKIKDDLYTWFWKVVKLGRIPEGNEEKGLTDEALRLAKVGNLSLPEIGQFNTSVRDCMNLANLGKIFGHRGFGDYWQSVAMITSATSMSKKGWFMDLSISQKKVRERSKSISSEQQQKKWRVFNKPDQNTQ